MDPINYSVDVQTPFQAGMAGYQAGAAIRNDQLQQQQQQLAMQQQQQQRATLQALMSNPNPTAKDYADATILIPGMKDQFKQSWDMRNTDQQQNDLSHSAQVYAALQGGQPDVAAKILTDRAAALRSSGNTADAQHAETMAGVVQAHPDLAKTMVGMQLASIPGGDKVINGATGLGTEDRAQSEEAAKQAALDAEARIKGAQAATAPQTEAQKLQASIWGNANLKSQIEERAARLGLDKDRLTSETQAKILEMNQKFGQLPDDARSLVNSSSLAATSGEQAVQQYQQLAGKIDALGGSWGTGSSAKEFLKRATGNEDAVSALKREYTRMASQGVIKLLPPGPASDKDIANAKEGIPDANAAPDVMSSYLRGMAKLSAYDAVLNNAKAEWVGQVQHLGRAKTDIVVDGTRVPAGTTFNDFARSYLASKADALNAAATVGGRSYMRFALPAAGANSAPAAAGAASATPIDIPQGDW